MSNNTIYPINYTPDTEHSAPWEVSFPVPASTLMTDLRLSVSIRKRYTTQTTASVNCYLYDGSSEIATRTIQIQDSSSFTTYTADFSHSFSSGTARIVFGQPSANIVLKNPTLTSSALAMTADVDQSTVYIGDFFLITVHDSLGRSRSLQAFYGSTPLDSDYTAQGNIYRFYTRASWFTTAGVSGNTLPVTIRINDDLGRETAVSGSVKRAQGSVSISSPNNNADVNGSAAIPFSWRYSGDGSLSDTELYFSEDRSTWTKIATVYNGETSWQSDPAIFPPGTNYWKVTAHSSAVTTQSDIGSFNAQYNAASQAVPVNSPTSGIVNGQTAETFSVTLEASAPVYSPFTIASAVFYWRAGSSGAFTSQAMTPASDGITASVEIPANTFPSGTLQWYAEATDNTGRTTQTDTYALTVMNASIEASPISPINTIESADSDITFRWAITSIDGSLQGRADLEYSTNGTDWVHFGAVEDATQRYTAPGGTFPGGDIYWRVIPYNENGDQGLWTGSAMFICFSASVVSGVVATSAPFTTITWQASGQVTYQIDVGGKIYGPYFGGNVRAFTAPEPLPDGMATVKVRVMNLFNLWSEWSSADAVIANSPGDTVTLTATGGVNAELRWATADETADFYIYRDGVKIGHTTNAYFTDRTALGARSYFVLNRLPGGYYTKSNTVTVNLSVESPMLAPLAGGDFLALRLSENQNRSQSIQRAGEVAYTQYCGATYPEAEIGEHESLSASGDSAWTYEQRAEASAFEAMLKKPVIYKTPGGEVVVGVLEGFQRRDSLFFKSYSFSVTQMQWRDFVDES